MDTDFRALVESAYTEAESGGSDGESAAPVSNDLAVGDADTSVAASTPESDAGGSSESAQPKTFARDSTGKFAKAETSRTTAPRVADGAPSSSGEAAPPPPAIADSSKSPAQAEALRAPQGWKPAAREAWTSLPPEVKSHPGVLAIVEDAVRREKEHAAGLQESAPARRFQQEFSQAVQPFEGMLRQAGFTNPIQAAQAAFTTIHQLQAGSPRERAQVFANLLRTYQTDIEALDGLLAAPQQQQQPQQYDPATIARIVDQRVNETFQQRQSQATSARIESELAAFQADPANEFFQDVMPTMTGLIHANPRLTLKEAYARAVWADDGLRDIMQKRAAQQAAKVATASTQQARNAASSVKSTPSTGASSVRAPKNIKEIVEASFDSLNR